MHDGTRARVQVTRAGAYSLTRCKIMSTRVHQTMTARKSLMLDMKCSRVIDFGSHGMILYTGSDVMGHVTCIDQSVYTKHLYKARFCEIKSESLQL